MAYNQNLKLKPKSQTIDDQKYVQGKSRPTAHRIPAPGFFADERQPQCGQLFSLDFGVAITVVNDHRIDQPSLSF